MPEAIYHFPPDFRWGVATAAHQVEGSNTNNQWWQWEQQEGRIKAGGKSGLACDWWQSTEADFDHAAALGLNALRLSVEWSRIEPQSGRIDPAALDRYRYMLESLRKRGIEPMITLHHFSDPLWFTEQGGWETPRSSAYFKRYVEQVVNALGEYTTLWCTINEPNVYSVEGYLTGIFPPGRSDPQTAFNVIRNMLVAHGEAYTLIHQLQPEAQVGLAHNMRIFDPENERSPLDNLAAFAQDFGFNQAILAAVWDGLWLPPLGFGFAKNLRHTLDWVGLNYYTRDMVAFDRNAKNEFYGRATHAPTAELLQGGYGELYPEGLFRSLKRLARLGIPIYITENGTPDSDDTQRPRALLLHLHQMWRAIQHNIPVQGYYHWTLTDNFEWAEGWTMPFGLIYMDPETRQREPRISAALYSAVVQGNAITPEVLDAYVPSLRKTLLPE